jgi:hypothetical protein
MVIIWVIAHQLPGWPARRGRRVPQQPYAEPTLDRAKQRVVVVAVRVGAPLDELADATSG